MVEIIELNREPASTVSTLTATTEVTSPSVTTDALEADTITDGADVSHTGELADLADVSSIQSPSDVVITDTQAGTVNDQEFLKNEGGNLTGATVQTTPNEPDWTLETTLTDSGSTSYTLSLNAYDELMARGVMTPETSVSQELGYRMNGVTSTNYDYQLGDGTEVTSSDRIFIPNGTISGDAVGFEIYFPEDGMYANSYPRHGKSNNPPLRVENGYILESSSPITSLTFLSNADPISINLAVFGRDHP